MMRVIDIIRYPDDEETEESELPPENSTRTSQPVSVLQVAALTSGVTIALVFVVFLLIDRTSPAENLSATTTPALQAITLPNRLPTALAAAGTLATATPTLSIATAEYLVAPTLPMATDVPLSPTPEPTSAIRFLGGLSTGVNIKKEFSIKLGENEMVVGDADEVNDKNNNGTGCFVFYIVGPIEGFDLRLVTGSFRRYTNVYTEDQVCYLVEGAKQRLKQNTSICTDDIILVQNLLL